MSPYNKLVEKQRSHFFAGKTQDLAGRRKRVETFKKMLTENKKAIDDAIFKDLHRTASDVDFCLQEINVVLDGMEQWVQPVKMQAPNAGTIFGGGIAEGDDALLVPEPLGVCLIIGPWNYPLVTVSPLVHAFAAGNTVIVKPSELDPTFCDVFAALVPKYFDEAEFAVVLGGIPETSELLKERFDHILYTGCPPVAKIIMTAAAKHLTPVTLELGGKNPVFVDESADLAAVAKGVVSAKLTNAGQICICTDYLMTTPAMKPKVIEAISAAFDQLGDLSKCEHYARIVNERHYQRLTTLLEKTNGKVVYTSRGAANAADKFLPVSLVEVAPDDELMKEEIFGPILAIVTMDSFDAALEFVKRNEKPLASYLFTTCAEQTRRWLRDSSAGGVSVNDTFVHATNGFLPFGGVGNSGMGRLNGKYGFDQFSHEKPVVIRKGLKVDLAL